MNKQNLPAPVGSLSALDADFSRFENWEKEGTLLTCPGFDNSVRWNKGERFHHLYEKRFEEISTSESATLVAVDTLEEQVSFLELEERSNRIARYLMSNGVRPGDRIGLLLGRSAWSYAAMLAISKSGAAWVPLDSGFPPDRIAYIVDDAQVSIVLSELDLEDCLGEAQCGVLCLDEDRAEINAQTESRPDLPMHEYDSLCYLIYTSGSTGRPKGVAVNHSSICNFIRVASEVYGIKPGARMYQGMTFAFDFSFEEIWIPLFVGATLVPARAGAALLGDDLAEFVSDNRISAICCVPTLLATLELDLPQVDFLLVSGEACPADLIDRWHRPGRVFLNVYGPTEATVTATWANAEPGVPVTIGRPLPTYTAIILDQDTPQILVRGAVGEIAVAGIGVAEFYLNRPNKTKAAFIPDFLNIPNNPGKRLYRTGDLGRFTKAGEIEYMGRIDTQVKIRGYRIELSEIESVIMKAPGVLQCVVETYEPAPGIKELVAYYTVTEDCGTIDPDTLYAVLRDKLPGYMIPAYLEAMAELPLLPSNKVDRKKLLAPTGNRHVSHGTEFACPETPTEKTLADLWAEILGLEAVSAEDHFIDDLGANSLLLSRFCAKARKKLDNVRISIKDAYLAPTVRKLAELVQKQPKPALVSTSSPACKVARDAEYYRCGALQALTLIIVGTLLSVIGFELLFWIAAGANFAQAHLRAVLVIWVALAVSFLLPVYMKWGLVGRCEAEPIPVWSMAYFRFALVRAAIRSSPFSMFAGTPVYNVYLRALGARIGPGALIGCAVPGAPDLFEVGEGTVIRASASVNCYRASGGIIETGPIQLGKNAFVGSGSVLDINTSMGDDARLDHASYLSRGQVVPFGKRYHGSPAVETNAEHYPVSASKSSTMRKALFCFALPLISAELAAVFAVLSIWLFSNFVFDLSQPAAASFDVGLLVRIAIIGGTFFVLALLVRAALLFGLPRLLSQGLQAGKVYQLFGITHILWVYIAGLSNSIYFNLMLGDSSFIVWFSKLVGYKLDPVVQTGSNFGLSQSHEIPYICRVGSGTMISDGFRMVNSEISNTAFKLDAVTIGGNNFVGNNVLVPQGAQIGDNCMLATKVGIPIDGPVRHDTGLLGSPCFEIPRSVERDKQIAEDMDPDWQAKQLKLKDRANAQAIGILLAAQLTLALVLMTVFCATAILYARHGMPVLVVSGLLTLTGLLAYSVGMERAALGFRKLSPRECSIFDSYYWTHERFWKFSFTPSSPLMNLVAGTPFRGALLRLLGVSVGKRLFDDGCWISEKSITEIGDDCTLGEHSVIQGHSLEDAAFKSEGVRIGNRCTVGANAFVHLGADVSDEVAIEPDSFVMKGTKASTGSTWQGNPAQQVL